MIMKKSSVIILHQDCFPLGADARPADRADAQA
jgi:hypothetical protein